MKTAIVISRSEADTDRLGRKLGELLPAGAVVGLNGPLGAGKTRLVQGIAAACGHDPRNVVSPTFTLVQEYRGSRPVYHFDVYRLRDDDEFLNLGPDEYFYGDGITVLEWAERVAACLPPERLEITIRPVDENTREFTLSSVDGAAYDELLRQIAETFHESGG
jgi:tRNA threonylcarbamoyladenosine biosynthesis protein TsaE